MKFVSKNINLGIVLKPGIPGDPVLGRVSVPGLFVKFEDGIANVEDKEWIKLMLNHPGYERDFIKIDDGELDPFADNRGKTEPHHSITNIEYGHVGKTVGSAPKVKLTPAQMNAVKELASKMAVNMFESMRADEESTTAKEVVAEKPQAEEIKSDDIKTEIKEDKKTTKKPTSSSTSSKSKKNDKVEDVKEGEEK